MSKNKILMFRIDLLSLQKVLCLFRFSHFCDELSIEIEKFHFLPKKIKGWSLKNQKITKLCLEKGEKSKYAFNCCISASDKSSAIDNRQIGNRERKNLKTLIKTLNLLSPKINLFFNFGRAYICLLYHLNFN